MKLFQSTPLVGFGAALVPGEEDGALQSSSVEMTTGRVAPPRAIRGVL